MKVLDHQPGAWFLLKDGPTYVFDTAVDVGQVFMSLTLVMTPEEVNTFEAHGREALNRLSDHVQRNYRYYFDRNTESLAVAHLVSAAIAEWNAANRPDTSP